jgi:hypothetical protein
MVMLLRHSITICEVKQIKRPDNPVTNMAVILVQRKTTSSKHTSTTRYTNHKHKHKHNHKPTQGIQCSNSFTFTTSYIKKQLKIHVDYTTKCLPCIQLKERYALDYHPLHWYWWRSPLRQPAIQDDVPPITPP